MQKIGDVAGSNADGAGEFTAGNPSGGVPATKVKAGWLNTVQRELAALVTWAGGALDSGDDAQLLAHIRKYTQPAGYVSLGSQISKGAGNTLNLPAGLINIGGVNGQGYLLEAITDWNPLGVGNSDGSFAALALGDNVYIYACQQASGIAKWVASFNTDAPTGYTVANSRKVGGFHYGRVRPLAQRFATAYDPATELVANSCWDLQHRPKCDPTGMVEVIPGRLWADIYLNSSTGVWPSVIPVSAYNATPINTVNYFDAVRMAVNAAKRLPKISEFFAYAYGAPPGQNNNTYARTAAANVGPAATGGIGKAISVFNVVDPVGNLGEITENLMDALEANVIHTRFNAGEDVGLGLGSANTGTVNMIMGGGGYSSGTGAGCRFIDTGVQAEQEVDKAGFRCVCESL